MTFWTPQREDFLRENHGDMSAAKLADLLNRQTRTAANEGFATRNAVIGKCLRLGLVLKKHPPGPAPRPAPRAQAKAPRASAPAASIGKSYVPPRAHALPQPPAATSPIPGVSIGIMQLTGFTCRWPLGDPATEDFGFCGAGCNYENPYCATHHAMAYAPKQIRQSKKKSAW